MESFLINLKDYIINLGELAYIFLFVINLIPGAGIVAPILGGFFSSIGYLKFVLIFPILVFAEIIVGIIWYFIGYFSGRKPLDKWGHKIKLDKNKLELAENYFSKYAGLTVFFGELSYGFTIAVMIIAGVMKMNFKKFVSIHAIGAFLWILMIFSISYFFGFSYKSIEIYIKDISLFFVFLSCLIVVVYLLNLIIKKIILRFIKIDEFIQKIKNILNNNQ